MMRSHFWTAAATTLLAACGLAAPAPAAFVRLSAQVSSVVLSDGESPAAWLDDTPGVVLIGPNQGMVFAIFDVAVSIANLAGPPGEIGLGNVLFDIDFSGGAAEPGVNWIADAGTVDHDGIAATPPVRTWSDANADLGAPGDEIDIFAGILPATFGPEGVDPRRTIGQNSPQPVGQIWGSFDSSRPGNRGGVYVSPKAFSTYDAEGLLSAGDGLLTGTFIEILIGAVACSVTGDTRPCDGRIDLDDLNAVRNNFGTLPACGPASVAGDTYPFDCIVDIDDLNAVRTNFGQTASDVTPVPEPAGLAMVALAALFGLSFRQRPVRLQSALER